jgi:geranylgeranylglycerol-phosphate geranylgeranyltransferase
MEKTVTASVPPSGGLQKLKLYIDFARPFTLIAPAFGVISGGITAWGAYPVTPTHTEVIVSILMGSLMAAFLNSFSNTINQIYDLPIDRINKPARPLPSGKMTIREAWIVTAVYLGLAWTLAWFVTPYGHPEDHSFFWIVLIASVMTYMYSAPPFRTKRRGILANITVAIPRGILLKVAGWSTVKQIWGAEPWYIGTIFGLFLLGATTTKDFADMKGDAADGCRTLPIVYGPKKAAWMISPFFILPWILIPIGVAKGILTGNAIFLSTLGALLAIYGTYTVYTMVRKPEELAVDANHVSWAHMYRMMFVGQAGFMIAYLIELF